MNADNLEYLVSQYADGSLSALEVADVEKALAAQPEARELLQQYRTLDGALRAMPLPAVRWEALTAHLSNAVAAHGEPEPQVATKVYAMPWVRSVARWSIAAAVLLATGVGIHAYRAQRLTVAKLTPDRVHVEQFARIEGPQAEASTGQAVADVEIGPPPALADGGRREWQDWGSAEAVVTGAPRVIIASGPGTAQDKDSLQSPY